MRLIDADARIEDLQAELKAGYMGNERAEYLEKLIEDYKDQSTVEVRPNIHAHWVKHKNFDGFKIWICSNCSCRFGDYISTEWGVNPMQYAYGKYCGYCGAKMDEVIHNEAD